MLIRQILVELSTRAASWPGRRFTVAVVRTELTRRAAEKRLDAYATALMDALG
ncbi:hypothetical protein [Streptomyces sp. OspMP-M43]|uniref:hypothetical protein n=1 Tax=Streptomyces sp. OspMP-M43 TaxID=1839781 RepID=UPI00081B6DE6|nr:hypothetical protein [Streptomyces sp. OspMP-M43]SCE59912.1 hypothetical protein GA0115261_109544 [Streptomyces sp. OspMP-M43]